jgi:hypothetical protein
VRGAVYLYEFQDGVWSEVAQLTAGDGADEDAFGTSVSIRGDTLVVGAPTNQLSGAAYVYVRPVTGWASTSSYDAKLTASDGQDWNIFGWSVAISGDTIVIGSSYANEERGSAYVYVRPADGWATTTEDARLTASDGARYDDFGYSLDIDDDTIVVGARNHGAGGAAYVYVRPDDGWTTTADYDAKLTASDGGSEDRFGVRSASAMPSSWSVRPSKLSKRRSSGLRT